MSAFSKAAPALTTNVSGIFGIATAEPSAVKEGVVLGIKSSLSRSAGFDHAPAFTVGQP